RVKPRAVAREARRDFLATRGYAPGGAFYFYGSSENVIFCIRNLSTEDGFPAWRIAAVAHSYYFFAISKFTICSIQLELLFNLKSGSIPLYSYLLNLLFACFVDKTTLKPEQFVVVE